MKTAIIYSSSHGTTEKVAKQIQFRLGDESSRLINLKATKTVDLSLFDTLIIGGSIHAGYTVKSKESKDKVFQMFLKAADAIPHLRAHLVNYNYLEEIEKLSIPYHLIQCEFDRDINKTLKTTLEAISKNKKARVVQLKGAGHIANLDKPDEFNQVLLKIITESNIDKEK